MKRGTCLLILVLALLLTGCVNTAPTEATRPTEAPMEAREAYEEAVDSFEDWEDVTLHIQLEQTMTLGTNSFYDALEEYLYINDQNTRSMTAYREGTETMGSWSHAIRETFVDGVAYSYVKENSVGHTSADRSRTEMTAAQFEDSLPRLVLLDEDLYETVEYAYGGSSTIVLRDPERLEWWLTDSPSKVESVTGLVQLNEDGSLKRMSLMAEYTVDSARFEVDVVVTYAPGGRDIQPPEGEYREVDYDAYQGEGLLRAMRGRIRQMKSFAMVEDNQYASELTGLALEVYEEFQVYDDPEHKRIHSYSDNEYIDIYTGESLQHSEAEDWNDGDKRYWADESGPYETNTGFEYRRSLEQDAWLELLPEHDEVTDYYFSSQGGTLLLSYDYTDEYAQEIESYVNKVMYDDRQAQMELAQGYATDYAGGYVGIDLATMLPTTICEDLTGYYVYEGHDFTVISHRRYSLHYNSGSIYNAITGEQLPLPERE